MGLEIAPEPHHYQTISQCFLSDTAQGEGQDLLAARYDIISE